MNNNEFQSMYNQPVQDIVPAFIQMGKQYSEGQQFDDLIDLNPHYRPYKLYSIIVSQTEKYIQGVGFKYKVASGEIIETKHNLCNYFVTKAYFAVTEREFILGDDDYIKRISCRFGDWIDWIEIETYLGKNQNYGGKGGDQTVDYCFPGYTFSVVSGSYRTFLDHLNLRVIPIPDQFQQKLNNKPLTAQILYPTNQNLHLYPQISYSQQPHIQQSQQNQSQQQPHIQQSQQNQFGRQIQSQYNQTYPQIQSQQYQTNHQTQYQNDNLVQQSQNKNQQNQPAQQDLMYDYPSQ